MHTIEVLLQVADHMVDLCHGLLLGCPLKFPCHLSQLAIPLSFPMFWAAILDLDLGELQLLAEAVSQAT
eukprot:5492765-Prorocentrum_lima.AAC.1